MRAQFTPDDDRLLAQQLARQIHDALLELQQCAARFVDMSSREFRQWATLRPLNLSGVGALARRVYGLLLDVTKFVETLNAGKESAEQLAACGRGLEAHAVLSETTLERLNRYAGTVAAWNAVLERRRLAA